MMNDAMTCLKLRTFRIRISESQISASLFCMLFFSIFLLFVVRIQSRSVGILYEVWHAKAATSMRLVEEKGLDVLTVETVIRSNGKRTLDEVYGTYGSGGLPSLDIYNAEPEELGFYCLYKKRDGDANPPIPDCKNTSGVARRHATLLREASVDYVAIDVTNWPQMNDATDIAVIRPLEVLFEEWTDLRSQGIDTPMISVWVSSPIAEYSDGHETTWQHMLDRFYNNETFADLIWRDESTKKKVFFVTANNNFNKTVDEMIASNAARDDVKVVPMWALFGKSDFEKGWFSFFSPCTDPDTSAFTTSMLLTSSKNRSENVECHQFVTRLDDSSTQITASGAYMTSQCSLPFSSPGKLRGWTMQRLFQQILETKPNDVFLSSWNELIGGRQKPAYTNAIAFNMGLPNDPQRFNVWVDTYGTEFSRDIEPTVEGGDIVYQMMKSCVGMYKRDETCSISSSELCCDVSSTEIWHNVWSLRNKQHKDFLVTTDVNERDTLVVQTFDEVCAVTGSATAFCLNTSDHDGRDGPFMLYTSQSAVQSRFYSAVPIPLYRCISSQSNSSTRHFISTESSCEGKGKLESLLGFMSDRRGGETLRELRRCATNSGHSLDLPCMNNDGTHMGFVR